jgi:hypothetical protein
MIVAVDHAVQAQNQASPVDGSVTVDTGFDEIEEIIVRGRRFGDLRFEIRRSEEAVFARFNEINSTDDFDIECHSEKLYGFKRRACMPNFARDLQARASVAMARAMQGEGDSGLGLLYAQQARRLQGELDAEMRQLAAEDAQLRDALAEFSAAQLALNLARGTTTLSRQVTAASGTLPYGAELMFEIVMGNKPWTHSLTRQTFTIADLVGEIRRLTVECDEGRERIDYESSVEWTLPNGWSACTLRVNGKRESKFRLYEF